MTQARTNLIFGTERLLLDELTHRINNEFSAAIGVLSLAAARARTGEAREVLRETQHRLENFARVQRLLRPPQLRTRVDGCAYLRQLCEALSQSKLRTQDIELQLVERKLPMDSEQCWLLGMIVSELVANSTKHAFAAGPGQIRVEISRVESFVQCQVRDNGTAARPMGAGGGLRIVEALVQALGGGADHDFSVSGSTFTVVFPAAP